MKANKKPLWESLRPKSAAGKSFSYEDLQNFDLKKMVTHFSLMCPGVSLSTLTHDVSLYGGTGKNFKQKNFIQENFHAENIQAEDFQAGKVTTQKSKKQEN